MQIVSASTQAALSAPASNFTVLIPPPRFVDTLLAAFRAGDVDRDTARSTLLLHILPQRLTVADLRALRSGASVPTLSRGANVTVRQLGAATVAVAHGGVRAVVTGGDMPACSPGSVLHGIDTMLLPEGLTLPPDKLYAVAGGGPEAEAGGVGSDGGGLAAGVVAGIVLACTAGTLAVVAGVLFLRKRRAARLLRAAKTKDPVPRIRSNSDRPTLLPSGMRVPPRSDTAGPDGSPTVTHSWNPVATLSEFADDDDEDDGDGIAATVLRVPGALLTAGASSPAGVAAVSLSAATGDPSSSSQAALRTAGTLFSTTGTTPGSSARHAQSAADMTPPPLGARAEERRQWLSHQLDLIGTTPLLQHFVMLGPTERRHSGVPPRASPLRMRSHRIDCMHACREHACRWRAQVPTPQQRPVLQQSRELSAKIQLLTGLSQLDMAAFADDGSLN